MKFLTASKILMIALVPILIFLIVLNFAGFDPSFYQEKAPEYDVQNKVPEAVSLNEKVFNFIMGKSNKLPAEFNEREKQHLWDVKNIVRISTIALYAFIALFALLLIASAFILKINNHIINFMGKVLIFGGFLTVALSIALLFFINSDFAGSFESFHKLLFDKGTYIFDPAKEMIVRLYPEQFFLDIGIRVSKWIIISSAIIILLGAFLMLKSKSKKIKRNAKLQ